MASIKMRITAVYSSARRALSSLRGGARLRARPPRGPRFTRRRALIGSLALAAILAVLAVMAYAALQASLPRREGRLTLPGLSAPVTVELDERGVPRVRGRTLPDTFRAQGFLHAQERFFQMDLARRSTAGELAALVGARALPLDREARGFQYRRRARAWLETLPPRHREWLEAYAEGVNAGLADLGSRPPEYWLLRARPAPWTAEDSALIVYYFCAMLSQNETYEKPQAVMEATLPAPLYDFLTPSTSRFDRPLLLDSQEDPTGGYQPAPIPPPEVLNVRGRRPVTPPHDVVDPPLLGAASNQWVVGAARSSAGTAMLANDPHLRLRLPNVFYRSELYWEGGVARGIGIPGVPGIILGATDRLAWGATVSNADQSDWVVVEVDPDDPSRYRTPEGWEPFVVTDERIEVRGGRPEVIEIRATRWGPVLDADWMGRPLALRATWLSPGGVSLDILELLLADGVEEGLAVLGRWAGPANNWVLADHNGRIAWTVNGPLPSRRGFDGSVPRLWADGDVGWDGEAEEPVVRGGPGDVLFTANNRTLPAPRAAELSRVWMRPFRAYRIDALLRGRGDFAEAEFLDMQLDTRAAAYDQFRDLVLEVVPLAETDRALGFARKAVSEWSGEADPASPGFRILQAYYQALLQRVLTPLLAPALQADPQFVFRWPLSDEPLRRLIEERPHHLLPWDFPDWPSFLRDVLAEALHTIERDPSRPGLRAGWGEVNQLDVGHVLAGLPFVGPLLRLPPAPLPGSPVSLRVAAPSYGAVARIVVAPAAPQRGVLQMPGGQSGHFLSPHFTDLQSDWLHGIPTPFLAGETVAAFELVPQESTH